MNKKELKKEVKTWLKEKISEKLANDILFGFICNKEHEQ